MKTARWLGLLLVVILIAAAVWLGQQRSQPQVRARVQGLAQAAGAAGFARTTGPRPLSFPADYGPHPDFQTEWWYYTGNLAGEDGRHFGYQFTIFRRAMQPPAERAERGSDWGADQVYMGHFALTDVASGQFHAFERLATGRALAWPARRRRPTPSGWRIGAWKSFLASPT
ncbi:MAG: lipocalin-like domain-containing protein [Anaerolineae bacterium]